MDNLDQNTKTKVNTFLKVLVVLTLINSIFVLASSLMTVASSPSSPEEMSEERMKMESSMDPGSIHGFPNLVDNTMEIMETRNDNKNKLALYSILSCICAIGGCVLMLKTQKRGFYLYLIAELITIITCLFYYGISNPIGMIITGYFLFTSALFILLYSLNLKQLK